MIAPSPPSGVVTFAFTDVVGSTRRWAREPESMRSDLLRHDEVVLGVVGSAGGHVFSRAGDSFAVAFASTGVAIGAAVEIQARLAEVQWWGTDPLLIRVGIHVGEAIEQAGDYFGGPVNLAARITSVANGGQVVVSEAAYSLGGAMGKDLGLHRLRDIDHAVRLFQVGDGDFPPLASADRYISNLPRQRTSFVGRDRDIGRLKQLLDKNSLVTVVGPGGVGKTRLVIEAAAERVGDHPNGVFFVDLAPLADLENVPSAVAMALELSPGGSRTTEAKIVDYLAPRDVLLVVDNCEHVVDAAAELVDHLLAKSGALKVLATSREALGIDGEAALPLRPLPAETPSDPAVRLFVQRAVAADSEIEVTAINLDDVVEICRRLDGIPLAVELAAARVTSMTLQDISRNLDHRFALLTGGGRRRRPRRQQALETAIDWSYGLLSDRARVGLRSLSVFESWFPLVDAMAVLDLGAEAAQSIVDELMAKSMMSLSSTSNGTTLYRLLESVREFARDRLIASAEAEAIRDRYHRHVVSWIATRSLAEQDTAAGIERLTYAWSDIVTVAETVSPADRIRLAGGLSQGMLDPSQVSRWLNDLDTVDGLTPREREAALRTKGGAHFFLMELDELRHLIDESGITIDNATSEEALCLASSLSLVTVFSDPATTVAIGRQLISAASRLPTSGYAAPTGGMVVTWSLLRVGEFERGAEEALQWLPLAPHGGVTYTALALVAAGGFDLSNRPSDVAGVAARWNDHWEQTAIMGTNVDLITALGLAATDGVAAARESLATSARLRAGGRQPIEAPNFLALFGRLHWIAGNHDRANELLQFAGTPAPYADVVVAAYRQHIEGWPSDEFGERLAAVDRSQGLSLSQATQLVADEIDAAL